MFLNILVHGGAMGKLQWESRRKGGRSAAMAGREREKQICGVAKGENEDDEVSL
jgi:hypothetical protein